MNGLHPDINTLWAYQGPGQGRGQLHQVVLSSPGEVVTVGMPYGNGYGWLGSPRDFNKQFVFKARMP